MSLEYNLQLFADGPGGEKTEQPTQKKRSDARKEGTVAKSKEINNAFSLFALFLMLKFGLDWLGGGMVNMFSFCYEGIPQLIKNYEGYVNSNDIQVLLRKVFLEFLILVGPVFVIAFLVAFICDVAQVKWKPTSKPLQPKLSKLDPLKGFKKIFSANSLVELLKAVLKIVLILVVVYNYLKKNAVGLFTIYDQGLWGGISLVGSLVTGMGLRISVAYLIIAFSDYAYQRWKTTKDLKMTKQEVKEEYKEQEGDPQIKGKIRQKMREASQRRMMQNLPKADVVITNPTHYAVALMYDAEKYAAPVVIAKGENYLAQKIKEVARANSIEIVENKPLARMLYHNVEIGEIVPPELYQDVAEVLAFVYHLKGKV